MSKWQEIIQVEMERALTHLRDSEAEYLSELRLLLLIEDKYLPKITGVLRGVNTGDLVNYYKWADAFGPIEVLKEISMDTDDVKEIRRRFAREAHRVDPNRDWYVRIRHIQNERRAELKGKAKFAWDFYKVAEMLGLFLQDITGEKQPYVDDLLCPKTHWKQQLFGIAAEDFDYEAGNALPSILRYYELHPRIKVLAIFEGQSEMAFVQVCIAKNEIYLDQKDTAHYLRDYGMMIVTLQGNSGLNSDHVKGLARLARAQDACVFVVVDADLQEELYTKQLQDWKNERLIGDVFDAGKLTDTKTLPIGGMLWKPCFEEANFTRKELVDAWIKSISKDKRDFETDLERLNDAIDRERDKRPSQPWITCMSKVKAEQKLPFSKVDIARELAEAHWESDKPIVRFLQNIFVVAERARTMRYSPSDLH